MNKGRLVGGIVCLVLAVVLGVLSVVLPPDSMIFYAGEENLRWFPALVLGIAGIALLATAGSGRSRTGKS